MNISTLTADTIEQDALRNILPELYQLQMIVENNPWHAYQGVFDHTIAVYRGMEEALRFEFVNPETKRKIQRYFVENVNSNSRKEILLIATLLHDCAKAVTIINNSQTGTTACPGHEILGSYMAENYASRLGVNNRCIRRIQDIVLYHGFVHDILSLMKANGNKEFYFVQLKKTANNIWRELLLLGYADMLGSDIERLIPEEFISRKRFIIKFLETEK